MTDLERAMVEAEACGVTRLADITDLDVLGLCVFQAVRPWGRCLSVHQGKGLTPEAAKIGALMEAVEFDHGEAFIGDQKPSAFDDLDLAERVPTIADFFNARDLPTDLRAPLSWIAARRPIGGGTLWVPHDCVSLDYTRRGDPRLDRTSNGVGARFDIEGATRKALLEVIERDADCMWRSAPAAVRSEALVEAASIAVDWMEDLRARVRAADMALSIYHLPAVVPLSVFACEIYEPGAQSALRRRAVGVGCGFAPEEALLASVLEAAQSRLTAIAGVRDDVFPSAPVADDIFGLAFPPSTHRPIKRWDQIDGPSASRIDGSVVGLARALAQAGYPDIGVVDLSRTGRKARVVKAFVAGLAAFDRTRRPPVTPACR